MQEGGEGGLQEGVWGGTAGGREGYRRGSVGGRTEDGRLWEGGQGELQEGAAGRGPRAIVLSSFTRKTAGFLQTQPKSPLKWPGGQLGGGPATVSGTQSQQTQALR